jgi:hypothetical protein
VTEKEWEEKNQRRKYSNVIKIDILNKMSLKKSLLNYWESSLLQNNFDRLLNNKHIWWIGRQLDILEENPIKLLLEDKNLDRIVADFGKEEIIDEKDVKVIQLYVVALHLRKKDDVSLAGKVYFVIPYKVIFTKNLEKYEFTKLIFSECSKFNKDCLEPWGKYENYVIGRDSLDEEYVKSNISVIQKYEDLFRYANNHFKYVTGSEFKEFINKNLWKNNYLNFLLTIEENQNNICKQLHATFDEIHKDNESNLMDLVVETEHENRNVSVEFSEQDFLKHSGQMDRSDNSERIIFPIDASQRMAIMAALKMTDKSIQAINGPPGTGKTTMLQSVIASMWINFAIDEKDPPIITATAATNQAVTNIISSFEKIPNRTNEISVYSRWIPHVLSYGWYVPSQTASLKPENEKFQKIILSRQWKFLGKPARIFEMNVDDIESKFMSHFYKSFENTHATTLEEVKCFLHQKLSKNQHMLSRIIKCFYELKDILKNVSGHHLLSKTKSIANELDELQHEMSQILIKIKSLVKQKEIEESLFERVRTSIKELNKLHLNLKKERRLFKYSYLIPVISFLLKQEKEYLLKSLTFFHLLKSREALIRIISEKNVELENDKKYLVSLISELENKIKEEENIKSRLTNTEIKLRHLQKFIIVYQNFWLELNNINKEFMLSTQKKHFQVLKNILTSHEKTIEICIEEKLTNTFFEYLDLTLRAYNFHLASRYWETRFILYLKNQKMINQSPVPLKAASYLGCCFVSTLYTLPKLFLHKDGFQEKADLLIVDEAGQASPEKGVSLFYWAKKALVVGDIKQIRPITNTNESDDDYLCSKFNIGEYKNILDYSGYLSSSGSLMSLAQACSTFKDKISAKGITLTYHYRCLPTIINFCNELLYNGDLRPVRKESSNYFLPPVCYSYHNTPSTRVGLSWKNDVEASMVAEWLHLNFKKIIDYYKVEFSELSSCIAIITPFQPHAKAIKYALEKKFKDNIEIINSLIIGTAHSLQGAEKPIVIFSNAYFADDKQESFIDRDPNILNVIVSRAQDSLILFGHKKLFSEDNKSLVATKQLANYMAKHGSRLFPRSLVIVESPEKAAIIERYLKGKAIVIATKGHFMNLTNVEFENGKLTPIWEPSTDGLSFLSLLKEELRHCDTLYIATDVDREGDAIGWHITRILKQAHVIKQLNRMEFHHIEEIEILDAFNNAKKMIISGAVKAAITRQVIDFIVGRKESTLLQKDIINSSKLSMGRVQAAYLDLVNQYGNDASTYQGKTIINASDKNRTLYVRPDNQYCPTATFKNKSDVIVLTDKIMSLQKDSVKFIFRRSLNKNIISGCSDTMETIINMYEKFQVMPWETIQILQALYESD